ncbi:mammalian cell entry protein [Mycobacterium sp. pUA109]|uniref:mammalian cell entry protein n=1 Tax=Mycobacterium sp. pUA109 TaxID=3238982 RepID=UPI00351B1580
MTETLSTRPVRRRASRAAGPAGAPATGTATVTPPAAATTRRIRPAGPPPRRPAHRRLVGVIAVAAAAVAIAVVGSLVTVMAVQQRDADTVAQRNQRFVDTAQQTVVNMFSYTQDSIDQSVQRFVNGTSGPLHDMMSQPGNVDNLKALFRETNASSETVINGAALEGVDEVGGNGSVLVSARVTVTDLDGVNSPSQPYRLRVIVHEDEAGNMTAYDLKYPNGGN